MRTGFCGSPAIEMKMLELAQSLEAVKGKKVYGYLKKSVKAQVEAVVDEIISSWKISFVSLERIILTPSLVKRP